MLPDAATRGDPVHHGARLLDGENGGEENCASFTLAPSRMRPIGRSESKTNLLGECERRDMNYWRLA